MYDVNYFIKKFESIPQSEFALSELDDNGKKCAAGHCGVIDDRKLTDQALSLGRLLSLVFSDKPRFADTESSFLYRVIYSINDDSNRSSHKYNREEYSTPKQRILAALYDIKQSEDSVKATQEILNTNLQPA